MRPQTTKNLGREVGFVLALLDQRVAHFGPRNFESFQRLRTDVYLRRYQYQSLRYGPIPSNCSQQLICRKVVDGTRRDSECLSNRYVKLKSPQNLTKRRRIVELERVKTDWFVKLNECSVLKRDNHRQVHGTSWVIPQIESNGANRANEANACARSPDWSANLRQIVPSDARINVGSPDIKSNIKFDFDKNLIFIVIAFTIQIIKIFS